MFSRLFKRKLKIPVGLDAAGVLDWLADNDLTHNRMTTRLQAEVARNNAALVADMDAAHAKAARLHQTARRALVGWRSTMDSTNRKIADSVIADIDDYTAGPDGAARLSYWFGLSRASWAVVSRAMAQEMPDAWQGRFADLLEELADRFPNAPDLEYSVRARDPETGRMAKLPPAMCNYRHPDRDTLRKWARQPIHDATQFIDAVVECLGETYPVDEPVRGQYVRAKTVDGETSFYTSWLRDHVTGHLDDLGAHFGDPEFAWDWPAAEVIAQEIREANAQ